MILNYRKQKYVWRVEACGNLTLPGVYRVRKE
uniref:Uncharacterized protein n=1 Tax=Anguilla anguilla TaxID=7936 RepID=A0A0E9V5P2_ANGAN